MRLSKKNLLAVLGLVTVPLLLLSAALFLLVRDQEGTEFLGMILIALSLMELLLGSLALLRWQQEHLSRPFKKLQDAAGEIRDGNLDHVLEPEEEDEFNSNGFLNSNAPYSGDKYRDTKGGAVR